MQNEKGSLSINSENLFPIIKKWLYSDTDIFMRELVSNACDAIGKLKRLRSLGEAKESDRPYEVHVTVDSAKKTLTISDNGIGMSADEVKKYINQIAFSGAQEFLEKYKDENADAIIGHFGLGFYSAFMVSELVEIETKSYLENEPAVHWSCDGSSFYEMTEGTRTEIGTDIILHLNADGKKYKKSEETRAVLDKYCAFMSVPIYFHHVQDDRKAAEAKKDAPDSEKTAQIQPVNDTAPLWTRKPNECSEDDYKAFYRKVFNDWKEPLFWIHLNMDYPFSLKGILYFPKLGNEFESAEGQVKLFCNQVFVADNVKEIIPEFLLLLKGVVDCPDLPLNVSRSFLQNDGYVRKISDYITRKVADKLNSLFNGQRKDYETYWTDIHPFIKYGCLRNEKFYDKMQNAIIYKSLISNDFITLDTYLENAPGKTKNKVFYATNKEQQAQYIELCKNKAIDVVELPYPIDGAFISFLESKKTEMHFYRVDSNLNALLNDGEENEKDEAAEQNLKSVFEKATGKADLKIRADKIPGPDLSAIIEQTEESRRFQEMMKMYGAALGGFNQPAEEVLVLNLNNPVIAHLKDIKADEALNEKDALLARQCYALARLSFSGLNAEELTQYIKDSESVLNGLV